MDTESQVNIVGIASNLVLAVLILNVLFCVFYRKRLNVPFRRLFYYLILNLCIEILALVWIRLEYNNLPLLHFYTLGEFILFSYFYESLIHKPASFKKYFWPYVLFGGILIIWNSIFIQDIYTFNTHSKPLVHAIIIGYAVIYFFNQLDRDSISLKDKGLRLINSGIVIYYSASLFIFMYGFAIEVSDSYVSLWAFNASLNLVFQILILCGLWIVYFRRKTL